MCSLGVCPWPSFSSQPLYPSLETFIYTHHFSHELNIHATFTALCALLTFVIFFLNFRLGYSIANTVYPDNTAVNCKGLLLRGFVWIELLNKWSTVGWIRGCRTVDTEDHYGQNCGHGGSLRPLERQQSQITGPGASPLRILRGDCRNF